jgi:hypothetical protein
VLSATACFDSDERAPSTHYSCADGPETSDDNGRCFVYVDEWAAWAQTITDVEIAEAIQYGILEPLDDPNCYALQGSTRAPCTTVVQGATLYGMPVSQLDVTAESCAGVGPWAYTVTGYGECFGVVDDLAVLLDRDREIPEY